MGNWHISIEGVGFHHNVGLTQDANRMAKRFVQDLIAAGHHIHKASFTHGGADELQAVDYTSYEKKQEVQ